MDKPYVLADGERLYLRVSSLGYKSWAFHYTAFDGRRQWYDLGPYGDQKDLKWARKKRNQLNDLLDEGMDPKEERTRKIEEFLEAPTFQHLMDDYIEEYARPFRKSWEEDKRILDREIPDSWKSMKARHISRAHIKRLYRKVGKRAPILANRLRSLLHLVFEEGRDMGLVEENPVSGVKKRYKERKRKRYLTPDEIRVLWKSLYDVKTPITDAVRRALKFILATAARPGEVAGLPWSEIQESEEWWNLPAERAKNGEEQKFYLNSIARKLMGTRSESSVFVFKSPKKKGTSLTVRSLSRAIRNAGHFGLKPFTPHDLRRTASTCLGQLGVEDSTISRVLTHNTGNEATQIYNQHKYDEQKKEAMDKWEKMLKEIIGEENS